MGSELVPYTLWGEIAFQIGGESLYVSITPDQMDDIIDSLENAMGAEEEGEGAEDDVEY